MVSYFPIFTQLTDRPCLVVGGGEIAHRKITALIKAGAQLTIIAKEFSEEVLELAALHNIETHERAFEEHDADQRFLIVAATDCLATNTLIYQAANSRHTWVNVVDDRKRSSFIVPSIVDRAPIMIAISSGGSAPVLAKQIREQLETLLPQSLGKLASLADRFRDRIKKNMADIGQRRRFWENIFRGKVASLVANNQLEEAEQELLTAVDSVEEQSGWVSIVGAGPGDPELLTLKALRSMQQADVILYDRLVSKEIMELVRRDAQLVAVGKCAGYHSVPQQDINQLLVDYASKGLRVCRLKGGDPFIFGRGGEEAQDLVKAGVSFDIVPGVTAAAGCSAYAGIPLTHRDYAQGVTFVTGHTKKDGNEPDWHAFAKGQQTLVVYMGLKQSAHIASKLIEGGRASSTPVAIVEQGTSSRQRTVKSCLATLNQDILKYDVQSPALLIIGEVVSLADTLNWFGDGAINDQVEMEKACSSI